MKRQTKAQSKRSTREVRISGGRIFLSGRLAKAVEQAAKDRGVTRGVLVRGIFAQEFAARS